jgi:hypothetical protein
VGFVNNIALSFFRQRLIGKGGHGPVYRASVSGIGLVALKELNLSDVRTRTELQAVSFFLDYNERHNALCVIAVDLAVALRILP